MSKNLQDIFAENFAKDDLEGAKRWIRKWFNDDEQILPGEDACNYSCRAMAGHISDYLEGYTGDEPESYNGGSWIYAKHNYLNTKYGPVLCGAAWGHE